MCTTDHPGRPTMFPDRPGIGPTSYTRLPRPLPTTAPTSKAVIILGFCKLLMTNVDYTATISETLQSSYGSISNSVRLRTITSGGRVMAGLLLERLGSFKRSGSPTPASFTQRQADLANWIEKIIKASWRYQVSGHPAWSHRFNF